MTVGRPTTDSDTLAFVGTVEGMVKSVSVEALGL